MASPDHIRNPIEWGYDQISLAALTVGSLGRSLRRSEQSRHAPLPAVCRIKAADLKEVLRTGLDDFAAYRTDVIFLCLIYPIVGIALAWLTFGYAMLPLLFPLASGFALIGPVAAVGVYEMSRRREQGVRISWVDALGVVRSPAFGAILDAWVGACGDLSALAARRQSDLPVHARPGGAGLDRRVRPRRVHDAARAGR